MDSKIEKGLFALLDTLDEIVLKYGGRIYLTKDVRVSKAVFEQGYQITLKNWSRYWNGNTVDIIDAYKNQSFIDSFVV